MTIQSSLVWLGSCLFVLMGFSASAQTALPVTTGLRMHLRADDLSLANGANVTAWDDQTAANNTPTTGAGTAPTFRTNQANGHAVVRFAGGNLVSPAINLTGTSALDLFIVARTGAGSGSQVVVETGSDFNASNSDIAIAERDDTCPNCAGGLSANLKGDAGYNQSTTAATLIGSFGAAQATFDKSLSTREAQLRVNGALVPAVSGTFDFNNTNAFGNSPFFVGGRGGGPIAPYFGDIAEIIFYSRKLTNTERTQVQAYLTARYAIVFQDVPVTSGLRLHLKADAGVTSAGGVVSAWADQSGNGFDVAATGSQQPAFAASAINGQPALTLDGNDDFLQSTAARDLLGGQQNYTFYAVTRPGTTQKQFADIFDYSHASFFNFVIQQDGGSTNTFYNNGLANQTLTAGAPSIYGGTFVNGGTITGTSRLNGGNAQVQTVGGPVSFGVPNNFRVGNWINGGREFNGQIAEILIFNRVLSGAEQQQVEAYLSARYDITLSAAPFGNVVQLNGTTDAVAAASPAFTQTDNFTLEAWIRPNALPTAGFQTIISNAFDNGSVGNGVALGIGSGSGSGGGSNLVVLLSGVQFFNTGISFPTPGQWYHVAVTRRSGTTFAYLDGVQAPNTLTTAPNAPQASGGQTSTLSVGAQNNSFRFLSGQVDEARAWSVGRTQAEIQGAMGGEINPATAGLTAYWRFNRTGQGAGLTVNNHAASTGVALNGTTVGAATTPVFGTAPADHAVQLNGIDDYIDCPADLNTVPLTLEAWVKPQDVSRRQYVICNDNPFNFGAGFGINNGALEIDAHNLFINVPGTVFTNGDWTHVAVVYEATGIIRAYIDGAEVFNADPNGGSWLTSRNGTLTASVGRHNPTASLLYFQGDIDDVRVWGTARTATQILTDATANLTGSETGLTVLYDMDRTGAGQGLTVSNRAAAAALDGTTVGSATTPVFVLASGKTLPVSATDLTFFPTSGSPGSVVLVTKNSGAAFTAATSARFNGRAATGTTFNTATQVTATVPSGATTGVLTTLTGATTLTGVTFTVTSGTSQPAPVLRNFTPLRAPVGTVIALAGANFTGVTGVRFGNVNAPGFVVQSSSVILVPVPASAVSGSRIYVLASGGMAQSMRPFTLILPPTLSALSPTFGTAGSMVVLTGTNLSNASSVSFTGGEEAPVFTVDSPTRITATIPVGALSGPVSVTTVAGTATTAASLTIGAGPAPVITSFSPASGSVGTSVTLTGTGFTGTTSVTFNGTPVAIFTVTSPTQITTLVPVGASSGRLTVLTARGFTRSGLDFRVTPSAGGGPVITSLTPGAGSPGSLVIINGQRLNGATSVTFGGGVSAASFVVNSATEVFATIPAGAVSGALTVTTGSGSAVSPTPFIVTAPTAPAVVSFTPTSGPVGTVVTVSGNNFTSVSAVRLGITNAPTFNVLNSGSLTFVVPSGAQTSAVRVFASGGLQQSAVNFTVVPPPTVLSFSPSSGSVGSQVQLTGTGLTGATSVTFGGISAVSFVVISATSITATVPAGAVSGVLSVTTPGGTATSASSFTVTAPAPPTITALSPGSGIIGSVVQISGTNLLTTSSIRFNGKSVESFVVTSNTQVLAQVPDGSTTGVVSVTTAGGQALSPTAFTVLAAPDIDGFTPVRGPVGTVITLVGTGLGGATSVTFGGNTPALTFSASPDGKSATATVPPGTLTGQVSLTNPVASALSAQVFTLMLPRPSDIGWVADQPVQLVPYPNPLSSAVGSRLQVRVLDWPAFLGAPTVVLYDALGRRLASSAVNAQTEEASFDVSGLPAGVYVVRCGGAAQRVLVAR